MHACFQVQIETPKEVALDGLWFGSRTAKRAIIHMHGLFSSAFSSYLVRDLADSRTAVITFNNRGNATIRGMKRYTKTKKGYVRFNAGTAHEVFTECIDDIQGAIDFAQSQGVQEVYLSGHSSGCHKSMYYLAKKKNPSIVKGLILLAPLSDYASTAIFDTNGHLARATKKARALVAAGEPHTMLPDSLWPMPMDAQRFLSLYTPDSVEEIFCYATPGKTPTTLRRVTVPTLVIMAGQDEYADRPLSEIATWFDTHACMPHDIHTVPNAPHNFATREETVTATIKKWLRR
jgi:pimeloyl-ACP methyl ester carboxylesterase